MPLTTEQRVRVVAAARTWINTPYAGWSRVKGGGVDCGQFLAGVYADDMRLAPSDMQLPPFYSLQVAQHKEDPSYIRKVREYMRDIPESEVLPGDVVLYKFGFAFAHAAIIISWPDEVIHAIGRHGVCCGHGANEPRFRKCERVFLTLKNEWCVERN